VHESVSIITNPAVVVTADVLVEQTEDRINGTPLIFLMQINREREMSEGA